MEIGEFYELLKEEPYLFKCWWRASAKANRNAFPPVMAEAEWREQYDAWLDIGKPRRRHEAL